jgi:monoamine oxidase
MITYTDGDDAHFWMNKNPKQVPDLVMKRIRGLFPELTIPDPLFFKMHPWKQGCTYWKPGKYSAEDESRTSLQPMPKDIPGLFLCGESFSLQQCWMEGAVEQAEQMMKHAAFQRVLKSVLTL